MQRIIFFILLLCSSLLHASTPRIVCYGSDDFKTHPLVFSVVEDFKNGVLYFPSAYSLLQYNGVEWKKAYASEALSVAVSENNEVFVGSENDFGVLKQQQNAKHLFTSLAKDLPAMGKTQVFRQILCFGKNTYFLSSDILVIYNGSDVKYHRSAEGENFGSMVMLGNTLVVTTSKGRAGKASANGIEYFSFPSNIAVKQIIAYSGKYLLLTSSALFWWDGKNALENINASGLDFSSASSLAVLNNGNIAVGTKGKGIAIVDPKSGLTDVIDKSKGIKSNIINDLTVDKGGDLWAATDNGVALIKYGSSYEYINDNHGVEGMGYAGIVFNAKVYLGTANGLYCYNTAALKGDPQKVEGISGFVHDLVIINGFLLCANEYGAYMIKDKAALKFTSDEKVWTMRQIPQSKDLFLIGTLDSLKLCKILDNGDVKVLSAVWGFSESCRKFEIEGNVVWVLHGLKGLYRVEMDKNFKTAVKVENFNKKYRFEPNYFKDIIKYKDQLLVASYGGVYSIIQNMNFVKSELFSKIPHSFHRLRKINEEELFIKVGQKPIILSLVEGYFQEKYLLLDMDYHVAGSAENITKLNSRQYLVGIEQGFALFSVKLEKDLLPSMKIREVRFADSVYVPSLNSGNPQIEYAFNNLQLFYNLPLYGNKEPVVYHLSLKRDGEETIDSTFNPFKEYTNLKEADYFFEVYAEINDQKSDTVRFTFSVLAPWYRTTVAYILYVLLAASLVYVVFKRSKKEVEEVREQLTQEKEEQKVHYEDELHKAELKRKEEEMAFLALNYAQKKQVLSTITEHLQKMMTSMTDENDQRELKNLMQTIHMDLEERDENKWEKFQVHLDNTQDNFFKKLKEKDPDLDESGLLMCSYIKMGKSNKEISNLLNISVAAVAKRKYRMKKKWNLEEDASLTEFMKVL